MGCLINLRILGVVILSFLDQCNINLIAKAGRNHGQKTGDLFALVDNRKESTGAMRKLRLVTLFVVLLGVASVAAYNISTAQASKQANKQYPAVGFTITYVETDTPPGGAARVIGIQVRYQKANGD